MERIFYVRNVGPCTPVFSTLIARTCLASILQQKMYSIQELLPLVLFPHHRRCWIWHMPPRCPTDSAVAKVTRVRCRTICGSKFRQDLPTRSAWLMFLKIEILNGLPNLAAALKSGSLCSKAAGTLWCQILNRTEVLNYKDYYYVRTAALLRIT